MPLIKIREKKTGIEKERKLFFFCLNFTFVPIINDTCLETLEIKFP